MEQHVKVVGVLYIVSGTMGVIAALICLMILGGAAGIVGIVGSSLNFPVKSPYGSPRSVKLLISPTCLAGEARCEAPRLS